MTAPLPRDTTAECRRVDPELFFANPGTPESEYAKSICAGCPLVAGCLDYALAHALQGVWGATDEDQRKEMRRRKGIVPLPVVSNPYPPRRAA